MSIATLIIARVMQREGGVADVGDGKGVTRWGQTDDWLKEYKLQRPDDPQDALDNYLAWLSLTNLIDVCRVDDVAADCVVDWAVHSHAKTAIKSLQRVLGIKVDGVIGPQTRAALERADRRSLAGKLIADRTKFIGRLVAQNPEKNAKYAGGWNNRVAMLVERFTAEVVAVAA